MPIHQTLQKIYHPYWCSGDPIAWGREQGCGLHGILAYSIENSQFPNVGLFNLVWLVYGEMLEGERCDIKRAKEKAIFSLQRMPLSAWREGDAGVLSTAAALLSLEEFTCVVGIALKASVRNDLLQACQRKLECRSES